MTTKFILGDEHNIPTFTHTAEWFDVFGKPRLGIRDAVPEHKTIYSKWIAKGESDVFVQPGLFGMQLGLKLELHDEGKDRLEFLIKLERGQLERLISNPQLGMIIFDEEGHLLYPFAIPPLRSGDELLKMHMVKTTFDSVFGVDKHGRLRKNG
jgi:hypothetical protein